MKTTHYNSLYILDVDALEEDEQNDLLMCGSQNWEHYFSRNSEEANIETLSNISIVEFKNTNDFESFIKTNQIIDFSLEHDKPMVLVHG
jgi:hypothetical protein